MEQQKELSTAEIRSGRMLLLDVLRGAAILLVLFHHSVLRPNQAEAFGRCAEVIIRFGWTGVDLFFVLSGFLVGGLLIKEIQRTGQLNIRRFLLRRAFKIWPAYFVFIGFSALKLVKHGGDPAATVGSLWPNFVHIQNYILTPPGHTWSLAVEEHFYLGMPCVLVLLLLFGKRAGLKSIPLIALTLWLLCFLIRFYNIGTTSAYANGWRGFATHSRVDTLFVGVLIAYWYRFHLPAFQGLRRGRWWMIGGGALCVGPMLWFPHEHDFTMTFGLSLLGLGYGLILAGALLFRQDKPRPEELGRRWLLAPVALVGYFSYSIYLWHMDLAALPVLHWMHPMLERIPGQLGLVVYWAVYFSVAIVAGAVLALLIEIPCLRIRERYFPERRSSVAPRATGEAAIPAVA